GGSAGKGGSSGSAGKGGSGGATTGAAGSTAAGGTGGVGSGGSGGARDAGILDCAALRMDLDQKLAAAQKCDAKAMGIVQCQDLVEGVCCAKVPVTSGTSVETTAYLDALAKFK